MAFALMAVALATVGGVRVARQVRRSNNPLAVGQCTWYAYERAHENDWSIRFDHPWGRHAKAWPQRVTNARLSQTPAVGEIMVLDGWKGNDYGHVAYVESVQDANHWTVSHANMAVGSEVRHLSGIPICLVDVVRQGKVVAFEGRPDKFSLIGFLTKSS
ncbi:MAG TPA: CHAP domain-containing protein [Fimbriimonadaceae bacterium]|nr:CHAP domain-containing protein [Fimbriimonadaceae bacterium]